VKRRILLGTFALSSGYYDAWYDKACRVRRLIHDDFQAALQDCDLLLGPTSPVPPWSLGEMADDPIAAYLMDVFTTGANLAGLPALSIPLPPTEEGLPVGLQLIGRHFDEATLLRVGEACNRVNGAHRLRPPAPQAAP
jgi:aspartyl-tRNA(Asn)/glutamyl-tRNA(Gln) amidotransferase subunit A